MKKLFFIGALLIACFAILASCDDTNGTVNSILKDEECYECTTTKETSYSDNRPTEERVSKTTKCGTYQEVSRWAKTAPQSSYETSYIAGGPVQVTVYTETTCKRK